MNNEKLLQEIAKMIEAGEAGKTQLVPDRIRCVELVYDAICCAISKNTAKVEYEIGETFPSVAIITITGKAVLVQDTQLFAKAVSVADNFEVCPLTNGEVQINLGFYNVTRKAEG